jgi:hypothetical protein
MPEGIEFRWITEEERLAIEWPPNQPIAIAVLDNKIVSVRSWDLGYRYKNCSVCPGNCAQGGSLLWTRREYRRQGIFRALHDWSVEDAGYSKIYYGGDAIPSDGRAIAWKYALKAGASAVFNPSARLRDGDRAVTSWVERVSPILGYDV